MSPEPTKSIAAERVGPYTGLEGGGRRKVVRLGGLTEVSYMSEKNPVHTTPASGHEVSLPPEVKLLQDVTPPFFPEGGSGMTILVDWPPGHPGLPPHRHSGPAFGYVMEGAIRFELEGEPEHVIKTGGTFWEPGGDVIHYQDGNALSDAPTKFLVTMVCAPGQPMLTLVDEGELKERAHLRAPRPSAG